MQGMQKHECFKEKSDFIRSMLSTCKLALKRAENGVGKPAWGLVS